MGKLFGTDGIRGTANVTLDCTMAYRIGQAAALSLGTGKTAKPTVVVGMDTRISSDMLEGALVAGLCSCGADVVRLGVISTPAVAYLTTYLKADAGAVISASHNPYEQNGVKMFSSAGFKLNDELEEQIENLILQVGELPIKTGDGIGRVWDGREGMKPYLDHLASTVGALRGLRIAVDCANGAASASAKLLFDRYGLSVEYLHDAPNGRNINLNCGSTHMESLCEYVRQGHFDVGFAFDGDADRCLAVDENGNVVDGDRMMAICASHLLKKRVLPGGGFVATVMSNLGLHRFAEKEGLRLLCASVGDRNVLEMMQREGMILGGEQSGHIIFLQHMPTGDGQLTALQFLSILCETGKKVSELASAVTQFPQVLLNVAGPFDQSAKKSLVSSPLLQEAICRAERELGSDGRILVRPSGTEALIRVMVEAPTEEKARETAMAVAQTVENLQK